MNTGDLFNDEVLDKKSTYDTGSGERGQDGLYRVDMEKVSSDNKQRGYRSVIRFIPNFTNNPEYVKAFLGDRYDDQEVAVGPSHYEKITHFLNIQNEDMSHLKGYYDCPTNINPLTQRPFITEKWGPLAKTYFSLDKSKNALMKQKASMIKYSKKYFSYVLIMEDEQQPELVGKIMIFSYGKQIKDIIEAEDNGSVTGEKCNIFKLHSGKDFTLLAKNKSFTNNEGKEVTAPEYTMSRFSTDPSPIKIPKLAENGKVEKWIKVPLSDNGNFTAEHQSKIAKFLLKRDFELESFAGKEWDEQTQARVNEAIDYLTGKVSSSVSKKSNDSTKVEDFSFDDASSDTEDDIDNDVDFSEVDLDDELDF